MSQMQSVSAGPRSPSDASEGGSNFRRNAGTEPQCVFRDFLPDLYLGLSVVPESAGGARRTVDLFAGVRTFELAQLLPGTASKASSGVGTSRSCSGRFTTFFSGECRANRGRRRKEKPTSDKHQDQPWRRNPAPDRYQRYPYSDCVLRSHEAYRRSLRRAAGRLLADPSA